MIVGTEKGTLGIAMEGIDMPFNKYGIRPDIIMNPNAVPSRMTTGQLWECLVGKIGAIDGANVDGTPFEEYDIEKIKDELEARGFHRDGKEYLYNGMTGKKMQFMIFFGPTFYQRLKHMTEDKIHSRARGPTTILVRQAPEGRSRDGGLRMGEMERDCCIAHGMARFLKERLMDLSDPHSTHVCGKCGMFARREEARTNKPTPGPKDRYYCPQCENYNDVHKVMLPYAFKLMVQELMAMCIAPRIRVQKKLEI
jgi:DNA-directed RNA polymerase II subunit RPB2